MTQKTTPANTIIIPLLYHTLLIKASKVLRHKYDISTGALTVLVYAYFHACYISPLFTIRSLYSLVESYNYNRLSYYINKLVLNGILCTHSVQTNKYMLTSLGIEIIEQMSKETELLLYEWSNRYNI